ncbi:MAG: DUF342 domain-containing protein [Desulfobacter sp.]|nr:DUF342 domain-containing protein [Desulfobacter sp.]
MTETPRILILEADEAVKNNTRQLLEERGWDVVCETVSKDALDRLEQAGTSFFHLFISSFKLPKMEGDDILEKARALSPLTQRMLMVPSDQSEMVIRAINKAEINACIVTPASDQDLLSQVESSLRRFAKDIKNERLKRVIAHQNKQMFIVAQRLKKKNALCQARIKNKTADKIKLGSKLSQAKKQRKDPVTLVERIDFFGIPITPQTLMDEFEKLAGHTRELFVKAAAQKDLDTTLPEPQTIMIAPETDQTETEPDKKQKIMAKILRSVFSLAETPDTDMSEDKNKTAGEDALLDEFIDVLISKDQARAFIKMKIRPENKDVLTTESLLEFLRQKGISFGIVDDKAIETWIDSATPKDETFIVAQGKKPILSTNGTITYEFETLYANPGKIMEDGRIDFRDRGDIPYASKNDLLATKTPAQEGKDGISVAGLPILIEEAEDPVFTAGNGTRLSQDGLKIYSTLDGQPHLDPLGEISVNPELSIAGDVDFETGNIDFKGNVVVAGTIEGVQNSVSVE